MCMDSEVYLMFFNVLHKRFAAVVSWVSFFSWASLEPKCSTGQIKNTWAKTTEQKNHSTGDAKKVFTSAEQNML